MRWLLLWSCAGGPEALAADTRLAVGTNENAAALGLDADTLREGMTQAIDGALAVGDQVPFLAAMDRATAIAATGLGVDYAAHPDHVVVGFSVGTAFTAAEPADSMLPTAGISTQIAGMVGVPLSAFAPEDSLVARFTVFLSGAAAPMPAFDAFQARAATAGAHVQVAVVDGVGDGVARWHGLDLTTGVAWARYTLTLTDKLAVDAPFDPVTVVWRTDGGYQVRVDHLAVPVELSSSAHASVLGVFAGIGADLALGSAARSEASLSGNLITQVPGQSGETHVGEAVLTIEDTARSPLISGRVFFGPDLAFGPVHLYGQLNLGFAGSLGAQGGLRLAL